LTRSAAQTALKVVSCFGIKVTDAVVHDISSNAQYSGLKSDLKQAVEFCLLDLEADGSYRFAHDKVREASYDMIDPNYRSRFHFDIGMLLLRSRGNRNNRENNALFVMLDQINRGVPSLLENESERISVAELNYEAGVESFCRSNYTVGYQHAKIAISLLPNAAMSTFQDRLCI
jgi:predicted ATPase